MTAAPRSGKAPRVWLWCRVKDANTLVKVKEAELRRLEAQPDPLASESALRARISSLGREAAELVRHYDWAQQQGAPPRAAVRVRQVDVYLLSAGPTAPFSKLVQGRGIHSS